ncbi:MAG TPA: homoserine O-acetyltransferase [Pyrinomonadaceae bacterium]|nr:homoserine O-acetyltransferase [Pyrinomonadaceae bacterium]
MTAGGLEPTIEADYTFAHDEPFALVSGGSLQPVTLRYALYGELNEARDNAILVCHALSGSARVADWWPQLFGANSLFDTSRYCVIGINVIGSCYGSTGPQSSNPNRPGETYGGDFPLVTVSDMVGTQARLLDGLKIERLACVIGGSVGGMQALSLAVNFPERVKTCISIGAAPLSAMGLALNHLQRMAIRNDPAWMDGRYAPDAQPARGLALARALAMCSYKSAELFNERFARRPDRSGEDPHASMSGRFDVAGYLDYQGSRFTERFDANSYLLISKAMDNFDLSHGYTCEAEALRRIRARLLMVGISSDWLFPASDVRALTERAQAAGVDATYRELVSSHGHDGFLADAARLAAIVAGYLDEAEVLSGTRKGK